MSSWDSGLKHTIVVDGEEQPNRKNLALVAGAGVEFDLVDSEVLDKTQITISATGGAGVSGEDWFPSAKAATAAALPAYTRTLDTIDANANGAFPAIDGVTIGVGEDFVLQHGASHVDDGPYTLTAAGSGGSAWSATRRADFASESTVTSQTRIPIEQGTTYGGRVLRLAVNDPIVVNVTTLSFVVDTGLADGTATYQPLTWNGTAWVGAALNLAQAAAVTGVLGVANGGVPVPANPADDAKVLTASGGTYTWTVAPTGLPALGAANTVLRVNAAGLAVEYAKLTTTNLDAAAGILAAQLANAAAGTVLAGGTPNTWTATPTVTSLAATYIALGADPADAGAIRLSHAMGVYGESNTPGTDRAVLTWGVVADDVVGLGDAGTVTRITGSALHAYAGATQVAQIGVATSDFLKMGDVPASTGYLRVDDSWTLKQRNGNPGTADRDVIVCSGEGVVFGSTAYTGPTQIKGSTTTIEAGASQAIVVYASAGHNALVLDGNGASFGKGIVRASGAVSFRVLNGNGTTPYYSSVEAYNGTVWQPCLVARNVASGNCTIHIGENGGNISLWDATGSFGGGVKVLFGGTYTAIPTTAPVGGGLIYWDADGNMWGVNEAGVHTQLTA